MPTRADQSPSEKILADRATVLRCAPLPVVRRLSLSPEEGFLLSRLDRPMPVSELLSSSGLPETQSLQLLLRLLEKGALLPDGSPDPAAGSRWGSFVFSPAELSEDVDLEPERRKEILFLYYHLEKISHWRLLGVDVNAPVADVRRAYLEKSKVFHPDAYFRKRLGTYLPKVEAIFQRLRLAWETLGDDERRARYEREGRHFTAEEKAALVDREIVRIEEEKRTRARRERLLRARGFARLTRAREELASGDRALANGEVAKATGHYTLALELDPRLEEARTKAAEARKVAHVRRADLALEEALKAEEGLQFRRALDLLRSAVEFDATNPRAQLALGRLLYLNEPKSAREARMHVARALEQGETSGAAYLLDGELLLQVGQKKLAKRQLERACDLGEEERARPLLRKC